MAGDGEAEAEADDAHADAETEISTEYFPMQREISFCAVILRRPQCINQPATYLGIAGQVFTRLCSHG